jgi:phage terminase large subunit-like protein
VIARDFLGVLRLEDGRPWVKAAMDWQREDALAVLEGEQPYSFLTRARGGSKTTDLSAVMLSVLLASEDRLRCFWLAADGRQGELAIDCISGFVARTAALEGRVELQARKVIIPSTGASLEIMPADASGAWGLTPHWLFVDEIANWGDTAPSRRLWEAASSAVAKRPDARLVALTTSGSPDHFSYKVLEHARSLPSVEGF